MITRNLVLAAILCGTTFAAGATTAQQEKMKSCNTEAKTQALMGAERKGFMKTCLSNAPAAAATTKTLTPQQEKMKTCNADAKSKALKGADRKAFMKSCLSG